jgi:hypothetical protein
MPLYYTFTKANYYKSITKVIIIIVNVIVIVKERRERRGFL